MNEIITNIAIIALLILLGGVFVAAEMSLVSLRDSQIEQLKAKGKRGKTIAQLTKDPNRFLSAVQIGVTLSGFFSAAFGGALLSESFGKVLASWGVPVQIAHGLALAVITIIISYFSIVIGELTAKRLAMQRAEAFALAMAPMVAFIARLTGPIIWFLGVSTNLVVRALGGDPEAAKEEVTDDELRAMVGSSATLGDAGRQIVDEVFDAGETSLREAMIPRTEVDFLDGDTPAYKALAQVQDGTHSRYPVIGRDADEVLGFVHIRDLVDLDPVERSAPVSQLVRPVFILPETVKILRALTLMRQRSEHLAIVQDEYGGTAGIVTMEDLIEELVGDITDEFDADAPQTTKEDFDGLLTVEDASDELGYQIPAGPYDTLAGFVMAQLGAIPAVGDTIEAPLKPAKGAHPPVDFVFRVEELDGRRVARVNIAPKAAS
ncbi:MAG: hemolysin family protein [Bifidobacteriaceae bacterium]|nr:hemolysin family protein [Bifidobacteriaceae bacterium]